MRVGCHSASLNTRFLRNSCNWPLRDQQPIEIPFSFRSTSHRFTESHSNECADELRWQRLQSVSESIWTIWRNFRLGRFHPHTHTRYACIDFSLVQSSDPSISCTATQSTLLANATNFGSFSIIPTLAFNLQVNYPILSEKIAPVSIGCLPFAISSHHFGSGESGVRVRHRSRSSGPLTCASGRTRERVTCYLHKCMFQKAPGQFRGNLSSFNWPDSVEAASTRRTRAAPKSL